MSEREKQIMNTIIEGLPKMSEFEKGYVLGMVESKANDRAAAREKSEQGQQEYKHKFAGEA